MEIKELLTKVNRTIADNRAIKYIVVHYVGAVSTAYNNARYFENVDRQASAHYFVDDNEVYRVVAEKDIAWHCGTKGKYYCECRNSNSIGIEMCCFMNNGKLDISENIVNRTIELVKELMKKYNISAENVIRHYDVTHKICPAPFVEDESRWVDFKNRLVDVETTKEQTTRSIIDLANEVIAGKYGVGEARKQALGSLYSEVQAKVNEIMKAKPTETKPEKSVNELVEEVIAGDWGVGEDRKNRLRAAGYNYETIQSAVNSKVRGNTPAYDYYSSCSSKYNSIVDALNSINVDSSFTNRKKIAAKNNINNYTGTATQNIQMLDKLKAGKLRR